MMCMKCASLLELWINSFGWWWNTLENVIIQWLSAKVIWYHLWSIISDNMLYCSYWSLAWQYSGWIISNLAWKKSSYLSNCDSPSMFQLGEVASSLMKQFNRNIDLYLLQQFTVVSVSKHLAWFTYPQNCLRSRTDRTCQTFRALIILSERSPGNHVFGHCDG